MSLPKWNNSWDPPDDLRGRRGWAMRHYTNTVVVVALLVLVFALVIPGVLVPALVRHNRKEAAMEKTFLDVQDIVAEGVVGTFYRR